MKYIKYIVGVIAAILTVLTMAFKVNFSSNNNDMSDLFFENVEALAQSEGPASECKKMRDYICSTLHADHIDYLRTK